MSINPARLIAAEERLPAQPSLNRPAGPEVTTTVPGARVMPGLMVPDGWFRRPGQRYAGEMIAA